MKIETRGYVVSNDQIGKDTFHCNIILPDFWDNFLPGQFVQISCPGNDTVFLKRPISVYNYESITKNLEIIYKVVGKGTNNLSQLENEQSVELNLPLGNSFSPPTFSSKILLIAGGIGVAPVLYYLRYYMKLFPSATFTLLYGVTDQEEKLNIDIPNPFPGTVLFHADVERGINHGNLLDFYSQQIDQKYDLAISCGPTPMMKAFSKHLAKKDIKLEVSLESIMACGYGVCLGCAFPTLKASKTVCVDGPVFNAMDIDWNKIWTH